MKNRLEQVYDLYTFSYTDKKTLMDTLKISDIKLYYKLQGKIFVDAQKNLYKEIAQMLVNDCMKYYNKFEIKLVNILIDDMEFNGNIPADVITANKNRINVLKNPM